MIYPMNNLGKQRAGPGGGSRMTGVVRRNAGGAFGRKRGFTSEEEFHDGSEPEAIRNGSPFRNPYEDLENLRPRNRPYDHVAFPLPPHGWIELESSNL